MRNKENIQVATLSEASRVLRELFILLNRTEAWIRNLDVMSTLGVFSSDVTDAVKNRIGFRGFKRE